MTRLNLLYAKRNSFFSRLQVRVSGTENDRFQIIVVAAAADLKQNVSTTDFKYEVRCAIIYIFYIQNYINTEILKLQTILIRKPIKILKLKVLYTICYVAYVEQTEICEIAQLTNKR